MKKTSIHQNLLKKIDLASLKPAVDELDIDQLKILPVDLSKLNNVEKTTKTRYDKLVKKINAIQNIDTSDLAKKADYNKKVVEVKKKYLSMIKISLPLNQIN